SAIPPVVPLQSGGARLMIAGLATCQLRLGRRCVAGLCARDFGAPVSRCPESAASLVLLFLEADERGGRGRRLFTVEDGKAGGQQGARLLVQRDEALNVRDVVGVAVEDGEREGNKREHGEHGQEPRCEPESEPERRLSREKRHVTISLSHLAWLVGHCYD